METRFERVVICRGEMHSTPGYGRREGRPQLLNILQMLLIGYTLAGTSPQGYGGVINSIPFVQWKNNVLSLGSSLSDCYHGHNGQVLYPYTWTHMDIVNSHSFFYSATTKNE